MSTYTKIKTIKGNCKLTDTNICIPFCGDELQVKVGDEVKSYCLLNIKGFFPNGMCKIDTIYDSINENENNEIIYTQNIGRLPLKNFEFTLNNNNIFMSTETINTSNANVIIDYYGNSTLSNGYISIQDETCGTVEQLKAKIKTGYIYYILKSEDQIQKIISPNPDFIFKNYEDSTITIIPFKNDSADISYVTEETTDRSQFVTKKNLEYVYHDIYNKLQTSVDNCIKSINGHLTPDENGNVDVTYVELANEAINLQTSDTMVQKAQVGFRTTGGDDDITSGSASLIKITGRAIYSETIPSSYEIINDDSGASPDEYTVELVNEELWLNFLYITQGLVQLTDKYTFTYTTNSSGNKWVMTIESDEEFSLDIDTNELSTKGIRLISTTGDYTNVKFTIDYIAEHGGSCTASTVYNFKSVGYNLFDSEHNLAHVLGSRIENGESVTYPLRFIFPQLDPAITFSFSTDQVTWTPIEFEQLEVGKTTVPYVFSPPSDGYIKSSVSGEYLNQIMINLIWSGKRLAYDNAMDFPYKEKIINISTFNNNEGLLLNYYNGTGDELNLQNKELIRRIGKYSAANAAHYIFATCAYTISGSYIYVDFNTLNDTVYSRLSNYSSEQLESMGIVVGSTLPTQGLKSIIIDWSSKTGMPTNWDEYEADDFGTEWIVLSNSVKPELSISYTVNLIDKLRNRVVTYTEQDPSRSDQARAIGNLGLITVKCYIGNHQTSVMAQDEDGNIKTEVKKESETSVTFTLPHLGLWKFSATIDNITTFTELDINYYGNYNIKLAGRQYGFRRAKNIADPETRIEYIADAAGFQPIEYDGENWNLGDWENFINEVAAPVILQNSGEVIYLDRNDQTKKADGTSVDFSQIFNGNYNYNFMVEFRKYIYVKRYSDNAYEYVIFSDETNDDPEFKDYACIGPNGTSAGKFYWGMMAANTYPYTDPISGTSSFKLTSVPSSNIRWPNALTTITQHETYANNISSTNGKSHWHIGYKSGWDFICDLITLIGKNDDAQSLFGPGIVTSISEAFCTNDTTRTERLATGAFVKSANYSSFNKIFWIYNFYGNNYEPLMGFIKKNISNKVNYNNCYWYVKMFLDGHNSAGEDKYGYLIAGASSAATDTYLTNHLYTMTGLTQGTTAAGFIQKESVGSYGFLPTGMVTTEGYICDWASIASYSRYTWSVVFGAGATNSTIMNRMGPRNIGFYNYDGAIETGAKFIPRLSYV